MIEDLAIKLKVTDASIREQIDKDRVAIGLGPLKPYAVQNTWDFLTKMYQESPEVCHVDEMRSVLTAIGGSDIYLLTPWMDRREA